MAASAPSTRPRTRWASTGTEMRHNIGCAYRNLTTGKYDRPPAGATTPRRPTWRGSTKGCGTRTFLTGTRRDEFLESANPATGVSSDLQTIINQEAAAQGKSSIADAVRRPGAALDQGRQLRHLPAELGRRLRHDGDDRVRAPASSACRSSRRSTVQYRTYVFGRFISDVPSERVQRCPRSRSTKRRTTRRRTSSTAKRFARRC